MRPPREPKASSVLLGALILAAAGTWACGAPAPASGARRNLVFVLVDTLRADHLHGEGYARDTSRNLDMFAAGAVRFSNARSQAPCTFPSVNSLLSSRWPLDFLPWPDDDDLGVPQRYPYLPELLRAAGYRTVAVTASPMFRSSKPATGYNTRSNFEHGFDVFEDADLEWANAEAVNLRLRRVLERERRRPLFLYLHYLDPHTPYQPPAAARRFAREPQRRRFVAEGMVAPLERMIYEGGPRVELRTAELQHLIDLYDDEIAYFDAQFGALLTILAENRLWDDTIVAVASDHGEEFLEHGHIHHCNCLYDTLLRVPLMLRIPGVAPARHAEPVRNLDVVPTLLDYLGVAAGSHRLDGASLRDVIERRPAARLAFAWNGGEVSVATARFKLILGEPGRPVELFDLASDPRETRNLANALPREVETLRGLAQMRRIGDDEGSRERLRALGYVQ